MMESRLNPCMHHAYGSRFHARVLRHSVMALIVQKHDLSVQITAVTSKETKIPVRISINPAKMLMEVNLIVMDTSTQDDIERVVKVRVLLIYASCFTIVFHLRCALYHENIQKSMVAVSNSSLLITKVINLIMVSGYGSAVEYVLPKDEIRVRLPLPAPNIIRED